MVWSQDHSWHDLNARQRIPTLLYSSSLSRWSGLQTKKPTSQCQNTLIAPETRPIATSSKEHHQTFQRPADQDSSSKCRVSSNHRLELGFGKRSSGSIQVRLRRRCLIPHTCRAHLFIACVSAIFGVFTRYFQ